MHDSHDDELIDAGTAGKILGVSSHTVRRWAKEGVFKVYRIGNGVKPRIRLRKAEIVKYREIHME